jgi:hypothetical protein
MSNPIAASITIAPGIYFVLQDSTGRTASLCCSFALIPMTNGIKNKGRLARWTSQALFRAMADLPLSRVHLRSRESLERPPAKHSLDFCECAVCAPDLRLTHKRKAFKHIFTSPSSVNKEVKATRSGNARIHGMTRVTRASLAYVATQVPVLFLAHFFISTVP